MIALIVLDHDGVASRGALTASLYEDAARERAHASFRQLLRRTRAALPDGTLMADARTVWLRDAAASVDAAWFMGLERVSTEDLLGLASRRTELLEGIEFDEPDLQEWLVAARERLRRKVRDIVIATADATGGRQGAQALDLLHERFPDDPVVLRSWKAVTPPHQGAERAGIGASVPAGMARPSARPGTPSEAPGRPGPMAPAGGGTQGIPRLCLLPPRDDAHALHDPRAGQILSSFVEDVTIRLASARELAVIGAHTASRIPPETAREWAMSHGIDYLVETSIRGDGDGLRARLEAVGTGEIAWAGDIPLDQVAGRGPATGSSIANLMLDSVERAEINEFRRSGASTAYRHYLMGRHHLKALDLANVRRARKWFRSAFQIDPELARAHSWFANTLILEWLMMTGKDPELLDLADSASRTAINIDPRDGNGHRELARSALFRGDLQASLELFETAEAFAPHFACMLADYADTLLHNSRLDEAKARIDAAFVLNPLPPDTYHWIAGGIDFMRADFGAALQHLRRMANKDQASRLIAASAAMVGDQATAARYREVALRNDPYFEIRTWTQRLPIKDQAHLELYAAALKAAGFH